MISNANMKACLSRFSEDENFRYQRVYAEEARRLRAAGFISGEGPVTITADGLKLCKSWGIKTPQEYAREREAKERRDKAIRILSGQEAAQ